MTKRDENGKNVKISVKQRNRKQTEERENRRSDEWNGEKIEKTRTRNARLSEIRPRKKEQRKRG